jgi:hypothetical protein
MNPDFKNYLLKVTESSSCEEIEIIQPLWSGYGKISRYQLDDSPLNTVVVKFIALNQASEHPRGWNTDFSHQRKVKSYQIETHWYKKWNHLCPDNCRVPQFIGAFSQGKDQWIILEDLTLNFPLRKQELNLSEVKVCLQWLANFHATFLNHSPSGLWKVGTYWHLKTRPDEFKKMVSSPLKSKAHLIDELLNNCSYQTIVHGDAKLANFCFSQDDKKVAAVDFQYVGGGCGMKDVAYFLGSCLSSSECSLYQNELLDFYFSALKDILKSTAPSINFQELEREWRKLYPVACTDFTRFLLGWMPAHQKVNAYHLDLVDLVLLGL